MEMQKDRFKKLSDNYSEYFEEVYAEQGFSYEKSQRSVLEAVKSKYSSFKTAPILDIGCGSGATLMPFITAGCTNLTGLDLNKEMLESAKRRLGPKVKLIKADATNLSLFKPRQFDIITTCMCIHNIPFKQRKLFWKELLRLKPKIFVAAEKIADPDPYKHKRSYQREVNAIIKVYRDKYKLDDVAKEWVEHYVYDEREKLTLEEIKKELSKFYDLSITSEIAMCKTVLAIRKESYDIVIENVVEEDLKLKKEIKEELHRRKKSKSIAHHHVKNFLLKRGKLSS